VLPLLRALPQVNSARTSGTRLAELVLDPRFEAVSGLYFDGPRDVESSRVGDISRVHSGARICCD
jgi:hypothetical protein